MKTFVVSDENCQDATFLGAGVRFLELELRIIRACVKSGMRNAKAKGM